jgi:hypothetical protein
LIAFHLPIFKTENCFSPQRLGSKACFAITRLDVSRRFAKFLLAKESCLAYALEN